MYFNQGINSRILCQQFIQNGIGEQKFELILDLRLMKLKTDLFLNSAKKCKENFYEAKSKLRSKRKAYLQYIIL